MAKAPSYNSLFAYFEKQEMTSLLTKLIEESAAPLAAIESSFAADSSIISPTASQRSSSMRR